jgi:eukaryotic-like serine/threonine-protein kinase
MSSVARRPPVATMLTVLAILGVALGARAYRAADEPAKAPPTEVAVTPSQAPPTVAAREAPIRGLPPERIEPRVQQPPLETVVDAPARKAAAVEQPAREKSAPRDAAPAPREAARPAAVAEASAPALLDIAVSPWGEVHINGKMHGVTPPLQELQLSPGKHRIEIRNSASQPHIVTVNAKPGERIRIKHKFD